MNQKEKMDPSRCQVRVIEGKSLEEIQASFNEGLTHQLTRTFAKNEVAFTCPNSLTKECSFLVWLQKEDSNQNTQKYFVAFENCIHSSLCKSARSQSAKSILTNSNALDSQEELQPHDSLPRLYCESDISLLKKQLQFESKGLISKSTELDLSLNIVSTYKFKCKNFSNYYQCPFQHYLFLDKIVDGKPFYIHKPVCSQHRSSCIMSDDNIRYNVVMRKIDSCMNILEKIVNTFPESKPKEILRQFAKELCEESQNFLYEGMEDKNIKRGIKKYFDNAVAKVKQKKKLH